MEDTKGEIGWERVSIGRGGKAKERAERGEEKWRQERAEWMEEGKT